LLGSVKRHLISDVPVGIFLSGGIDSTAITAIASKYYSGELQTFCAGFDFADGVNELTKASGVAKKFGTNHHEIHISGQSTITSIESLIDAHDEPFGDAADIPLYLLTKELQGTIKVVLQGDGGDEFFGGYSRYKTLSNLSKWRCFSIIRHLIKISGTDNTSLLRLQRFITAINKKNPALRNALLLTMESQYSNPLRVFNREIQNQLVKYDPFLRYKEVYASYSTELNPIQALFYTDSQIILKDTFLEKVDKSTMANSIEVRVPFLDKEITDFLLSLPAQLKVKNGEQKYLLKKALKDIVPDEVLFGKKTGFGVPYDYWLQTTLSKYFIDQISTPAMQLILDEVEVHRMFNHHRINKGNYGYLLWKTLILAIWINKTNSSL